MLQNMDHVDSPNVRKTNMGYLLLAELVLAVMAFAAVTLIENMANKHSRSQLKMESDHSESMKMEYFPQQMTLEGKPKRYLVILIIVITWLWVIGCSFSAWKYYEYSSSNEPVFLCDYEIRHQARVHNYVVQCVMDEGYKSVILQNVFLCFAVMIIHLLKLSQIRVKTSRCFPCK